MPAQHSSWTNGPKAQRTKNKLSTKTKKQTQTAHHSGHDWGVRLDFVLLFPCLFWLCGSTFPNCGATCGFLLRGSQLLIKPLAGQLIVQTPNTKPSKSMHIATKHAMVVMCPVLIGGIAINMRVCIYIYICVSLWRSPLLTVHTEWQAMYKLSQLLVYHRLVLGCRTNIFSIDLHSRTTKQGPVTPSSQVNSSWHAAC